MNLTIVIYALLAGLIPAFLWLWFWLKEDNLHPEPKKLLAYCFMAGCLSVIVAIILEKFAQDNISDSVYRYASWAAIEEVVKFLAMVLVVFRSRYLDEPIDAMMYCITVALGFAAMENALFILSSLNTGEISASLITTNLRFVGATLVHIVSSAIIGFAIGLSFYRKTSVKFLSAIAGILLAIALHAAFNLAIINGTATSTIKVFGWVWLSVVILIILFEEVKAVRPASIV